MAPFTTIALGLLLALVGAIMTNRAGNPDMATLGLIVFCSGLALIAALGLGAAVRWFFA